MLSKVLEKIVYNQLFAYFFDKEFFYPCQYGFRRGDSTELATTELIDSNIQKLDAGKLPLAFFRSAKAFDTLNPFTGMSPKGDPLADRGCCLLATSLITVFN